MTSLAEYSVNVYLNDINQMRPGRLEEVPDLAAHDVENFVSILKQEPSISKLEMVHCSFPNLQNTMIHLALKKPIFKQHNAVEAALCHKHSLV